MNTTNVMKKNFNKILNNINKISKIKKCRNEEI